MYRFKINKPTTKNDIVLDISCLKKYRFNLTVKALVINLFEDDLLTWLGQES